MNPVTMFLVFALVVGAFAVGYRGEVGLGIALFVVAAVISASLKMANVWQKFVILRMGKLQSVRGAGLFAIIPVLGSVVAVIDGRIQTTAFNAEQRLRRIPFRSTSMRSSSGMCRTLRRQLWPLLTIAKRLTGWRRIRCGR
jgi:hypothetical protein